MLRSMFGMGGTEILVILIVALLFLGPDKLPEAAKQISKGIRDIKKQSRVLQRTIEEDENIGGAIRDLKSALRGEDEPIRPKPIKPQKKLAEPSPPAQALPEPGTPEHGAGPDAPTVDLHAASDTPAPASEAAAEAPTAEPKLTLPATAGEPDPEVPASAGDDSDLAQLVKPAPNTIPRGASSTGTSSTSSTSSTSGTAGETAESELKHG
jgi:sec-independent protein translocase protein TatB